MKPRHNIINDISDILLSHPDYEMSALRFKKFDTINEAYAQFICQVQWCEVAIFYAAVSRNKRLYLTTK